MHYQHGGDLLVLLKKSVRVSCKKGQEMWFSPT